MEKSLLLLGHHLSIILIIACDLICMSKIQIRLFFKRFRNKIVCTQRTNLNSFIIAQKIFFFFLVLLCGRSRFLWNGHDNNNKRFKKIIQEGLHITVIIIIILFRVCLHIPPSSSYIYFFYVDPSLCCFFRRSIYFF